MEKQERKCWKDVYTLFFSDCGVSIYRHSKRAQFWMKLEELIYFRNEDEKNQKIKKFFDWELQKQIDKENRKKDRLEREKGMREKALDSIQVWDLFHDSWWYDMTHNDFLQVIEKKWSRVFCRYVCSEVTEWDNWFNWYEKAVKDSFKWAWRRYIVSKWWTIKLNDYRSATKGERDREYYFNYLD